MTITVRVFGLELLHLEASTDTAEDETEGGDCTTTPVGFTPSYGDQRWERGVEIG